MVLRRLVEAGTRIVQPGYGPAARDPDDDLTGEVFEVCSACHPDELDDVDPVELAAVRAASA